MHPPGQVRRLTAAALGSLLAAALTSCGDSGSVVATDSTTDGWKTIEYRGVLVDIPVGWDHVDMSGCEFEFERWTPPDMPACNASGGASFYLSATFDPAHGPGIWHSDTAHGPVAWEGYVYAGDFAVYAADDDRGLVRHLLHSVRAPGE